MRAPKIVITISRASQMQSFKESPYQNYIELRFNNRNLSNLNSQEILLKYKRNASVLSKIFTFERNQQPTQGDTKKEQEMLLTKQLVEKFKSEVEEEEREAKRKIAQNSESREKFEELLGESFKVGSREELNEVIAKLKQADLFDETHPYLVEHSPFFLNSTTQQVLAVTLRDNQQKSFFGDNELVFEELN